ncbi:MAG: hypothetical protein ACOC70_00165 [bacterium]
MKSLRLAQVTAVLAVLGFLAVPARTVSAKGSASISVRVPYTYYVWETRTHYRSVRRAVEVCEYRLEKRETTDYVTRRRWVEETYFDEDADEFKTRLVLKVIREPVTTVEYVRVPVYRTVYRTVREPYTVRIRVARRGWRASRRPPIVRSSRRRVPSSRGHLRTGYRSGHSRSGHHRRSHHPRRTHHRRSGRHHRGHGSSWGVSFGFSW